MMRDDEMRDKVNTIIRDCCESETSDPERDDTIMIREGTLREILERELCRAAPAGGDAFSAEELDSIAKCVYASMTLGGYHIPEGWNVLLEKIAAMRTKPKDSAPAGSGEVRSTHHVHRGPESLPCYCAGASDHPIGHEVSRDGERLAREFHETYERLAPSFGYETRQETRQFDPTTANGSLMIAVCAALLRKLQQGAEYQLGDSVMWQDSPGRWHPATICGIRNRDGNREYEVDAGGGEWGWYSRHRLRRAASQGQEGGNG